MGARWKWVGVVRRKLAKSQPQNTIIVVHINNSRSLREDEEEEHEKHDQKSNCERTVESKEVAGGNWEKVDDDDVDAASLARKNKLAQEQVAAIKIQSFFRGFLARRAFRALRSLVKVQALFRGVRVRKQQRLALHCMGALIRLQLRVRSRQLMKASCDN